MTQTKTYINEKETRRKKKNTYMKAMVYHTYGLPDVLQLKEVAKPTPMDDEVLIKVYAAAANAGVRHLLRGVSLLVWS